MSQGSWCWKSWFKPDARICKFKDKGKDDDGDGDKANNDDIESWWQTLPNLDQVRYQGMSSQG